jgi:signal transduction histidine kinase
MRPSTQNRWFYLAGVVTLAFTAVLAILPRGPILTVFDDSVDLMLTLAAGGIMLRNARSTRCANRGFWALMASGYLLWAVNLVGWTYYEGVRRIPLPDAWSIDLFLFLHLIPMIAAVALCPHRAEGAYKFRAGTLDFLLLVVWWVFLYAFVVFPSQYITVDVVRYDRNFGALYLVENGAVILMLGIVARRAGPGWRQVYLNLMMANVLYAAASQAVNFAGSKYYTGSLYDVPLIAAVSWIVATALSAAEWQLEAAPQRSDDKWGAIALRLAMLAILSLPALGLWTFLWDRSPAYTRMLRLFTILTAMMVLGVFVFMRQYLQDQALIRLLQESRRSFESEQRLQNHLIQREKLASLGQMIAGAAHEINHPLTEIMGDSEKLWSTHRLTGDQDSLVRKIVHHAQRTRELIASLLSFAQRSSGEKTLVDLRVLLQRSIQMREMRRRDKKIRIEMLLEANLPEVLGDGHQLFQAFVQIIENAFDALEESGGGLIRVSAQVQGEEVFVQFSDNGPGIKEPHRVFDPFYTTKPVGKGTGLGLSAVYGVMQDHQGQITCQNNPQGGASFLLRLPIRNHISSHALAAAHR